jgi:hypothetical protein
MLNDCPLKLQTRLHCGAVIALQINPRSENQLFYVHVAPAAKRWGASDMPSTQVSSAADLRRHTFSRAYNVVLLPTLARSL